MSLVNSMCLNLRRGLGDPDIRYLRMDPINLNEIKVTSLDANSRNCRQLLGLKHKFHKKNVTFCKKSNLGSQPTARKLLD